MKVSVRKNNNKKVIAKKPLTNLDEMNSSPMLVECLTAELATQVRVQIKRKCFSGYELA